MNRDIRAEFEGHLAAATRLATSAASTEPGTEQAVLSRKARGHVDAAVQALALVRLDGDGDTRDAGARLRIVARFVRVRCGAGPATVVVGVSAAARQYELLEAHGRQIQAASIRSLERSVDTLSQTQPLATAVAARIEGQSETLERVAHDLGDTATALERSVAVAKVIARRVCSHPLLGVMFALILIGIGAIAVVNLKSG